MNAGATPTLVEKILPRLTLRQRLALAVAALLYGCLTTCSPKPGALELVRTLGTLRVATINSPTTYYVDAGGPTGFDYDLARGFADKLGVKLEMLEASSPAEALEWVRDGKVQIAAAGLGVSAERDKIVRFSEPVLSVVPQLVYRMGNPRPRNFAQLEGTLKVPRGGLQAERLRALKIKQPELVWEETDDQETEALLYAVANGELDYTIANSDIISINQRYFPKLRVAFNVAERQDIAWAFQRSADASLYVVAREYLRAAHGGELERLRDRYFGHIEQVDYVGAVTLAVDAQLRLPRYRAIFEKAAERYGMDWRLLAAMGYQESHWRAEAVSPTGVKGIMMLTQDTAARLNVSDREDPAQSIWGGARYYRQIYDDLPSEIPPNERGWMALAAYNMGVGHLLDARELTRRVGADPNRWLDVRNSLPLLTQSKWYRKLKYGYARGYEAVTYVGNVRTYYDMLVWISNGGQGSPQTLGEPPLETPKAEKIEKDPLDINIPIL